MDNNNSALEIKQKDNFLLKKEYIDIFKKLTDEDAGKLIKGIFNYACTGDSQLDGLLDVIFLQIKNDIDKNEEKYRNICERNRKNGQLGGRPKNEKEEEPRETQENPVGNFGENTHISYNHISYNHNNHNNHNSYNHNNLEEIEYEEEKPFSPEKPDDNSSLLESIKEIVDYLNKQTKSNYRYQTKSTQDKIRARLREGRTVEDFKRVIDTKLLEWRGTEFEKYLSPDTLFGTKFEKYLNQKNIFKRKTLKDISMQEIDMAIEAEKNGGRLF